MTRQKFCAVFRLLLMLESRVATRKEKKKPCVVMLGKVGVGKSTLGNRICGDESRKGDLGPFEAKAGVDGVTADCQKSLSKDEKTGENSSF